MKKFDRRIITIKLSEHDANRLLKLVRLEAAKEEEIWQNYWKRLALEIETCIKEDTAQSLEIRPYSP